MNTLTRTIIVFVVVNLMTAGLALAQEIENPALPAPSSEPMRLARSLRTAPLRVRQYLLLSLPKWNHLLRQIQQQ